MRINLDPKHTDAVESTTTSVNQPADNANGGTGEVSLGNDHAELSMDQARVASYAAQISNLPEIRQEKVGALQSAINNGTYDVSPEQTAGAMMTELLGNVA